MAEFQSPRFMGDALLLDILNDPDTGTRKLGPGSPASSVATLQDALFDLMWNLRTSEPVIHDRSEFVVGIYGPKTTEAVKAFKTPHLAMQRAITCCEASRLVDDVEEPAHGFPTTQN